jgi:hypothetical protein
MGLNLFKDQCCNPACRQYLPKDALFCPHCQTEQKNVKSELSCSHCGASIQPDFKVCASCGRPLNIQEAVQDKIIASQGAAPVRWARDPSMFAQRLELSKGNRLLADSIIVEHGTTAMVLVDGAFEGLVSGGRYEIQPREDSGKSREGQGLVSKIASFFTGDGSKPTYPLVSAILVDSSDSPIGFSFEGLRSKDALKTSAEIEVFISIGAPDLFVRNVLRGADSYTVSQVKEDFDQVLRNALSAALSQVSFEGLEKSPGAKDQLLSQVLENCRGAVQSQGYSINTVRTSQIYCPDLGKVLDYRHEAGIVHAQEEAELDAGKKRLEILDQLLNARNQQEQKEILAKVEMEVFEGDQEEARFLREWERKLRDKGLEEHEDDRVNERIHKIKIQEEHRQQELEKIQRVGADTSRKDDMRVEEEVLAHEIKTGVKKTDAELEDERKRNIAQMDKAKRAMDLQREHEKNLREQDEFEAGQKAKEEDGRRKFESDQKRADQEHELERERMKAETERERIRAEREGRSGEIDLKDKHAKEKEELLKDHMGDLKEGNNKVMDKMEGVYKHSLDRITDVAANSRSSNSGPSNTNQGRDGTGQAEKITTCPTCRNETTAGFRHCPHCGHKFF